MLHGMASSGWVRCKVCLLPCAHSVTIWVANGVWVSLTYGLCISWPWPLRPTSHYRWSHPPPTLPSQSARLQLHGTSARRCRRPHWRCGCRLHVPKPVPVHCGRQCMRHCRFTHQHLCRLRQFCRTVMNVPVPTGLSERHCCYSLCAMLLALAQVAFPAEQTSALVCTRPCS